MGFKNLPYWTKWVIIAFAIAILLFLLTFWNPLGQQLLLIFSALGVVTSLLVCGYEPGDFCAWFFSFLIGIIQIGLIGALIRWIVGKIKSKK